MVRRSHRRVVLAGALVVVAGHLTGCALLPRPGGGEPPPVTVTAGDATLTLDPWTWCWDGTCADGFEPEDPDSLGTVTGPVAIGFPHDDWEFQARHLHPDDMCRLDLTPPLESAGDDEWTLPATGPPGGYEVEVFGRGPQGDVVVTFAVDRADEGELPPAEAFLDMLSDPDGTPELPGPTVVSVSGLPETPESASAMVTVTASDGQRTEVDLAEADPGCLSWGTVSLTDGQEVRREARSWLGPEPYAIVVDLTLYGTTHRAQTEWPDDVVGETQMEEHVSSTPLEFDPPLPVAEPSDYEDAVG